jgi:hypothetical protein
MPISMDRYLFDFEAPPSHEEVKDTVTLFFGFVLSFARRKRTIEVEVSIRPVTTVTVTGVIVPLFLYVQSTTSTRQRVAGVTLVESDHRKGE